MGRHRLAEGELSAVYEACAAIEIPSCTPDYLRTFLAGRLSERDTRLAAKVAGLNADEMDALCLAIVEHETATA